MLRFLQKAIYTVEGLFGNKIFTQPFAAQTVKNRTDVNKHRGSHIVACLDDGTMVWHRPPGGSRYDEALLFCRGEEVFSLSLLDIASDSDYVDAGDFQGLGPRRFDPPYGNNHLQLLISGKYWGEEHPFVLTPNWSRNIREDESLLTNVPRRCNS